MIQMEVFFQSAFQIYTKNNLTCSIAETTSIPEIT